MCDCVQCTLYIYIFLFRFYCMQFMQIFNHTHIFLQQWTRFRQRKFSILKNENRKIKIQFKAALLFKFNTHSIGLIWLFRLFFTSFSIVCIQHMIFLSSCIKGRNCIAMAIGINNNILQKYMIISRLNGDSFLLLLFSLRQLTHLLLNHNKHLIEREWVSVCACICTPVSENAQHKTEFTFFFEWVKNIWSSYRHTYQYDGCYTCFLLLLQCNSSYATWCHSKHSSHSLQSMDNLWMRGKKNRKKTWAMTILNDFRCNWSNSYFVHCTVDVNLEKIYVLTLNLYTE